MGITNPFTGEQYSGAVCAAIIQCNLDNNPETTWDTEGGLDAVYPRVCDDANGDGNLDSGGDQFDNVCGFPERPIPSSSSSGSSGSGSSGGAGGSSGGGNDHIDCQYPQVPYLSSEGVWSCVSSCTDPALELELESNGIGCCPAGQKADQTRTGVCCPELCGAKCCDNGYTCAFVPEAGESGCCPDSQEICSGVCCGAGQVCDDTGQCHDPCPVNGQYFENGAWVCPPGQFVSEGACRCPGGTMYNANTGQCELNCGVNQIYAGATCQTCTGGSTPNATQDECVCPAGQFIADGECRCPGGTDWNATSQQCEATTPSTGQCSASQNVLMCRDFSDHPLWPRSGWPQGYAFEVANDVDFGGGAVIPKGTYYSTSTANVWSGVWYMTHSTLPNRMKMWVEVQGTGPSSFIGLRIQRDWQYCDDDDYMYANGVIGFGTGVHSFSVGPTGVAVTVRPAC